MYVLAYAYTHILISYHTIMYSIRYYVMRPLLLAEDEVVVVELREDLGDESKGVCI